MVQQTKETSGVSVLDLRGGTCKICKLLSFFISCAILRVLLLAGTSSEGGGTVSWRGYFYVGMFSLGLGGGVVVLLFFFVFFRFSVPARLVIPNYLICYRTFRIFHRNFVISCWTLHILDAANRVLQPLEKLRSRINLWFGMTSNF